MFSPSSERRGRGAARGRAALVMGLFGVAFIFATFGYIAWEQRDRLIQKDVNDTRSNAFFLADHAARLFEATDLTLRQASTLIEGESWSEIEDSKRIWEKLLSIRQALPYIEDIWLSDSDGRLRLTSAKFPAPDINAPDRDSADRQVVTDKGLFIGSPMIGRMMSEPVLLVGRRLQYSEGTLRGTVSATVSLSYFTQYWGRLRLPKGSRVSLLRASDDKVLAQYPPPPDGLSFISVNRETFKDILAADRRSGTYSYASRGQERRGSYYQIGEMPLYVQVSIPADSYWKPWAAQARLYGAFAFIALLALLALTALASQQYRVQAANAALLEKQVMLRTRELQVETAALEVLNRTGSALASELDVDRIVQSVVDAGVVLAGAQVGAFFYHEDNGVKDAHGNEMASYKLSALSGISSDTYAKFAAVQNTKLLTPTFKNGISIRSADITADPHYAKIAPHDPLPEGHPQVRSYMAVPVVSRTGAINGALLFGHEKPGVFTARSERLMRGLAAQAAIALENGRLYQAAQHEIEERKQAQAQQSLLIRELHHRVKNTLATVQAVVGATARSTSNIDDFYEAFVGRIVSLANTHSLLTEAVWQTASLREILEKELSPYNDASGERVVIDGPLVELPSDIAVPIGMAVHELTTNATKYGALSVSTGRVAIRWTAEPDLEGTRLKLTWTESGGPRAIPPKKQGFGSRLLHRVLTTQLHAHVEMSFERAGLQVSIDTILKPSAFLDPAS